MKRLTVGVLAVLCLGAFAPATTLAQYGRALGDLYPSFSSTERVPTLDAAPFQPFDFYLVTDITFADIGLPNEDLSNGPQAWESYVSIADEIVVTSKVLNPPSSINVGPLPPDPNDDNWIVGTGTLVAAASTPYALVHYTALLLAEVSDLVVELGPADPSSFDQPGGPGPVPGWAEWNSVGECPNECLRPFARWQDRIVVNCVDAAECNVVAGEIEIAVGDREGAPGSFVELPVTVSRIDLAAEGDPSMLAGLDLTMAWDSTQATLTSVSLTSATSDWLMEYNASGGMVDISMASLSTIDVPAMGVDVLLLQFQLGETPGTTPLEFTDSRAFDLDQQPIDHVTVPGSLTVGAAAELLELALGDGFGAPGAEVDVPFTVTRVPLPEAGDPSQLAGIDLMVEWDGSVGTLVDVLLTPATSDWLMQFNPGDGVVDISMATLSAIDVPPEGVEMLMLRYRLESVATSTPLLITESRAFDLSQMAIDHITRDGTLTVDCEKGDVIPDGEVNSADAIRALFFAMDMLVPTPSEFCAADMNSDGAIDVGDVVLILQKAVGITPSGESTGVPFLYARSGDELGDVILHVENAAGLDLLMTYDPAVVDFVSASAPGSKGLTLPNEVKPGSLRLGFAKATAYEGDILLKFEVAEPHTVMQFAEANAFDELGTKQPVDMLSQEFIFGVTGTGDEPQARKTELLEAVPNPFNPMTKLRFVLAQPGDAVLQIFDAAGRRVRRIPMRGLPAGEQSVTWDGRDDAGARVASGAYLIRLEANGTTDTGRVLMLK